MNRRARLSVNLNKVALLRNSRHTGVPDLLTFARLAYEAGADGITVHPRHDSRHIRLKTYGCRTILFVDPDPNVVPRVPGTGADGIEIYTGSYAASARAGTPGRMLDVCAATARIANQLGQTINVGHDLNLNNIAALIAAMPTMNEASIGHELTADALVMGFAATIKAYKASLASAAPE